MTRLTLRERGRLYRLREGHRAPSVNEADRAWLPARLYDRLQKYDRSRKDGAAFDWKVGEARARQWVGVVQVPGLVLELLPKIDGRADRSEDPVDMARDNLLAMLAHAGDVPLRVRDLASLSTRSSPLHETLAALFAKRLLSELLKGPHRSYVARADDLRALRGKLDISRHVARNAARRERFSCRYEEYSIDTTLSQVLRATCRALLTTIRRDSTREAVGRCLQLLDDVSDVPDARVLLEHLVLDRNSERFAELVAFSRLVLEQQAPTARAGKTPTFSLLFDMDRVFEGFVASFLRRRVLPEFADLQLREQARGARAPLLRTESEHGALFLKPDLLLTTRGSRDARAVLDTKWKRLGSLTQRKTAGLSSGDLYQMFAYTRRYGVHRSVLLFPFVGGSKPRDFHVIGPSGEKEGSQICVRYVDLRRNLRRKREREALASELAVVLRETGVAA